MHPLSPVRPGSVHSTPLEDGGAPASGSSPSRPQPAASRQLDPSVPLQGRRASADALRPATGQGVVTPPRRQSLPARPERLPAVEGLASLPTTQTAAGALVPKVSSESTADGAIHIAAGLPPEEAALAQTLQDARQNLTPAASAHVPERDPESLQALHQPKSASAGAFFAMQNLRHAVPVAGVRTVVQGLAAPAFAKLVETHPQAALAAQVGLAAYSVARRAVSQWHSESAPEAANKAFAGHSDAPQSSSARRAWQGVQTVGIAAADVAAVALTAASMSRPELQPLAQTFAAIQLRAHALSQAREFLRPTINTVHVGNKDATVDQPPDGRNLRSQDVTTMMKLKFGGATGALEVGSQLLMKLALGDKHPWDASKGLATAAGAIAGVANMVSSSVEDHLVDRASAERMQLTDPSHVAHLHWESKNPLAPKELARQFERIDARVFNQMLPAMLAAGVMYGMENVTDKLSPAERSGTQAGVNGLISGVVLGGLLALTVKSYQLNDGVRDHRARLSAVPA